MSTADDFSDREIKMSHIIDDIETRRAKASRVISEQIPLLEDALHALRHDRQHVTDEYLERVILALRKAQPEIRYP
jgi:hypothetical protein